MPVDGLAIRGIERNCRTIPAPLFVMCMSPHKLFVAPKLTSWESPMYVTWITDCLNEHL